MAKIYPIGIQSFEAVREGGYVYVDKTGFIESLVTTGKYFFLSRPRRFGKSLLLSTIEAFYQGRKDLFNGLEISRHDHDWQPYPVIHIAMNAWDYSNQDSLLQKFDSCLERWERNYGEERKSYPLSERFRYIIEQEYLRSGKKVVILIDEYDKPLLDAVGNQELQDSFRSQLKAVYGNLKTCDQFIEFAMLTGVTRFGKLSIFSDLNNLQDISLTDDYSAICGMTAEEIRDNFSDGIRELAEKNGISVKEADKRLKDNYDGYHFSPSSPDIYNPFSLLNALSSKSIGSYWFSTGTPTFLIDMIKRIGIDLRDLEHLDVDLNDLTDSSFDLSNTFALMYQSGYLTIRRYDPRFGTVTLDYPNKEVEQGFLRQLMKIFSANRTGRSEFDVSKFVLDVEDGHIDDFMTRLQSLFAQIQYDQMDLGNLELHYRNVIYLVMKLMGFYTHAEMQTSSGRIDMIVKTKKYLYLFEFKMNRSAGEAMAQINHKEYMLPFKADGRRIIKIGANFDNRIRTISTPWIVEETDFRQKDLPYSTHL